MTIPAGSRLQRRPDALWRWVVDGVVVLAGSGPHDQPLFVQGSGAAVWAALAEPVTEEELVAVLAATFDADAVQVRADVAPVLDRLIDAGVVAVLADRS